MVQSTQVFQAIKQVGRAGAGFAVATWQVMVVSRLITRKGVAVSVKTTLTIRRRSTATFRVEMSRAPGHCLKDEM
jgi:hypothetical protein